MQSKGKIIFLNFFRSNPGHIIIVDDKWIVSWKFQAIFKFWVLEQASGENKVRAKCQRAIFQEERDEVSWAVDCLCILMLLHFTEHCFSLLQVLLLFKDYVPIGLDFFLFSVLAL